MRIWNSKIEQYIELIDLYETFIDAIVKKYSTKEYHIFDIDLEHMKKKSRLTNDVILYRNAYIAIEFDITNSVLYVTTKAMCLFPEREHMDIVDYKLNKLKR